MDKEVINCVRECREITFSSLDILGLVSGSWCERNREIFLEMQCKSDSSLLLKEGFSALE